jgi:2-polyprenyl-3-methyl-5-hydroxy-6-metoxy-1,4-benzoquinol methylase
MKKGSSVSTDHYSYRLYADAATAETFDERRFGGPIGRLIAGEQARAVEAFVGNARGRTILDVGTGTGRAAMLLARAGARVTAVDASDEMLAVARRRAAEEQLQIQFLRGDAHHLTFADRSFEVVISLRVLMHTPDWRRSLAELCRIADRFVIIDYPSARSFALLEVLARRAAHLLGAKTEPYRVLRGRAIDHELRAAGFQVRSLHRQFCLPIALHKAIGSPSFSIQSRKLSERFGLLGLFGSPITVLAERCAF